MHGQYFYHTEHWEWCRSGVLADFTLTRSDEIFSGSPYDKMHAVSVMIILHIMMMNRWKWFQLAHKIVIGGRKSVSQVLESFWESLEEVTNAHKIVMGGEKSVFQVFEVFRVRGDGRSIYRYKGKKSVFQAFEGLKMWRTLTRSLWRREVCFSGSWEFQGVSWRGDESSQDRYRDKKSVSQVWSYFHFVLCAFVYLQGPRGEEAEHLKIRADAVFVTKMRLRIMDWKNT